MNSKLTEFQAEIETKHLHDMSRLQFSLQHAPTTRTEILNVTQSESLSDQQHHTKTTVLRKILNKTCELLLSWKLKISASGLVKFEAKNSRDIAL